MFSPAACLGQGPGADKCSYEGNEMSHRLALAVTVFSTVAAAAYEEAIRGKRRCRGNVDLQRGVPRQVYRQRQVESVLGESEHSRE